MEVGGGVDEGENINVDSEGKVYSVHSSVYI
jgi:hypothetical protein